MRDLKLGASAFLVLWALGACGSCGQGSAPAAATQAQLAQAAVTGAWNLTVRLESYAGPSPGPQAMKPGHQGVDEVVFVSTCQGAGACTIQLWGPEGPDPQKAGYYAYYSATTGLEGPPVSTPMTQSGTSYSQTVPIGGFGGYTCPPSRTVPRPAQTLVLRVTAAKQASSGWSATAMSGTEKLLAGWGCSSAGAFTGWTVSSLAISGRPR